MAKHPLSANTRRPGDDQSVLRQIDELHHMSVGQLRKRWASLFGSDPGRLGRNYLIRRLAYRIQELVYGGLSPEARRKLQALASDASADKRTKPRKRQSPHLQPGTRLLRDWHGTRYEVIVQDDGFLYEGRKYRSLSAVARAITGSYWSGNRFFGLTSTTRKERKSA